MIFFSAVSFHLLVLVHMHKVCSIFNEILDLPTNHAPLNQVDWHTAAESRVQQYQADAAGNGTCVSEPDHVRLPPGCGIKDQCPAALVAFYRRQRVDIALSAQLFLHIHGALPIEQLDHGLARIQCTPASVSGRAQLGRTAARLIAGPAVHAHLQVTMLARLVYRIREGLEFYPCARVHGRGDRPARFAVRPPSCRRRARRHSPGRARAANLWASEQVKR